MSSGITSEGAQGTISGFGDHMGKMINTMSTVSKAKILHAPIYICIYILLFWGVTLAMFKDYIWLLTQELLLAVLGGIMRY